MNKAEQILINQVGGFNSTPVVTKTDTLEAMRQIAWEAYKYRGEIMVNLPSDRFNSWYDEQIVEPPKETTT